MSLKQDVFPMNPFLHTYSIIMIVDGLIVLGSIALSVWQSQWLYSAAGLIIAIIMFIILNKQCLKQLSCPKCSQHVSFEAGEGFVCKKCNTAWMIN